MAAVTLHPSVSLTPVYGQSVHTSARAQGRPLRLSKDCCLARCLYMVKARGMGRPDLSGQGFSTSVLLTSGRENSPHGASLNFAGGEQYLWPLLPGGPYTASTSPVMTGENASRRT